MIPFIVLAIVNITIILTHDPIKPFGDDSYVFDWNISNGLINVKITNTAAAEGWVGLGISDNGKMLHSDLNICYLDRNTNKITCADGYAQSYSFTFDRSLGGQDSISNISGSVDNGVLTVSYSKPLSSNDQYDKVITKGKKMWVLFSYRKKGNPSTENGQFNPHDKMIAKEIVLWE
jgi:hypothetical protein